MFVVIHLRILRINAIFETYICNTDGIYFNVVNYLVQGKL